jgi:hypothetical protein
VIDVIFDEHNEDGFASHFSPFLCGDLFIILTLF